jgi:hypothetical protein
MRKTYSEIASDITNIKALITSDGKIDAAELQSVLNNINDSYGKDVYNVKNYGATGDGSSDDTSAILAANAAMTANGRGVLYFPNGDYKVTSTITVSVPCTIMGDGGIDSFYDYFAEPTAITNGFVSRISYYDNSTPCIAFETGEALGTGGYPSFSWQMYNIGLQMRHASTPINGSMGIKAEIGRNFKMRDVSVVDFYDNMQILKYCEEYVIDSCVFLNPVNAQLICNNSAHIDWGDQCITNNLFRPVYRNSNYSILLQSGGGIKICNNKFNGTGGEFWVRTNTHIKVLLISPTVDTLICNNSIENFAQEAVYISGGDTSGMYSHTFHGNQIGYGIGTGYHAIRYNNCFDIAISGNVIIGASGSVECIDLTDSARAIIYGNVIRGYAGTNNGIYKAGILVTASPTVQIA